MAGPWQSDVELSPEAAARLIEAQVPELAPARLELLGAGWDNWAFRVNGDLVFRFPRRKLGAVLLEREVRVLPLLAPHLPLPIPTPLFQGAPAGGYPYPFAGYRLIPGETACRLEWTGAARAAAAPLLGRFLRTLHRLPVEPAVREWAPRDDMGKTDLPRYLTLVEERLAAMPPAARPPDAAEVLERMDTLSRTPPHAGPTCWVHGDLYARHLLADDRLRLTGVIDWGDVHLGDPALDLSVVYSFLSPSARPAFWSEYGEVDAQTQARARFRALFYGAVLTHYAVEAGDAALLAAGRFALSWARE
jgi:aminoglycoside phosphotransferase (APT) family kinase protein